MAHRGAPQTTPCFEERSALADTRVVYIGGSGTFSMLQKRSVRNKSAALVLSSFLALLVLMTGCGRRENAATVPVATSQPPLESTPGVPSSSPPPEARPLTRQAPDFLINMYQGEAIVEGKSVSLSQLRGKPVVLNFYAGNCPPCRTEMPALESSYQQYRDRVLLIGVDVGPFTGLGTREQGERLLHDLHVTYPAGTTRDSTVPAQFELLAMPSTFSIAPDGKIIRKMTGALSAHGASAIFEELVRASRP